jgi:hypothetical protein
MPLTTDDLVRLAAVGISSAEQLIEVARIADRHAMSHGQSRDIVRDKERDRKRAYRLKINETKIKAASEVSAPAANGASVSLGHNGTRPVVVPLVSPAPLPLILDKTVEKEVSKKKVKGSGSARASRLPDDFVPDETCEAIAREHGFTRAHWQRTIDGFRDYWKAQPGGKGLKADWQATCRNWLRREADNMKSPATPNHSEKPGQFSNSQLERMLGCPEGTLSQPQTNRTKPY